MADLIKDFAVRSKLASDAGRTAEAEAYQHCVDMVYQALREDPAHGEKAAAIRAQRDGLHGLVSEVADLYATSDRFTPFLPSDLWLRAAEMFLALPVDVQRRPVDERLQKAYDEVRAQFKVPDLADPPGSG